MSSPDTQPARNACSPGNCPALAMLGIDSDLHGEGAKNAVGDADLGKIAAQTLASLDFGRLFATLSNPSKVLEIATDPRKAGELFKSDTHVTRLGLAGADLALRSARCPARLADASARQPQDQCIEDARQGAINVRPLPEDYELSDEAIGALGLAGITEEALRAPLPAPEPPATPEA